MFVAGLSAFGGGYGHLKNPYVRNPPQGGNLPSFRNPHAPRPTATSSQTVQQTPVTEIVQQTPTFEIVTEFSTVYEPVATEWITVTTTTGLVSKGKFRKYDYYSGEEDDEEDIYMDQRISEESEDELLFARRAMIYKK